MDDTLEPKENLDHLFRNELTLEYKSGRVRTAIERGASKEDFYLALLKSYFQGDAETLTVINNFSSEYDEFEERIIRSLIQFGLKIPIELCLPLKMVN